MASGERSAAAAKFVCVLPLKAVESQTGFDPRTLQQVRQARRGWEERGAAASRHAHAQAVQREYGERYVESLGARPSKLTLSLVKRNVGVQESDVATRLRAIGYSRDEVHVTAPQVKHEVHIGVTPVSAKAMICVAATNELLADHAIDDQLERSLLCGAPVRTSFRGCGRGQVYRVARCIRAPGDAAEAWRTRAGVDGAGGGREQRISAAGGALHVPLLPTLVANTGHCGARDRRARPRGLCRA